MEVHPVSATAETEVAVAAPSYAASGTSFTVNITVQPQEPLGGMECGIRFNASVLEAQQVEGGDLFDSWWNSSLDIDNQNGTISQLLGFNYQGNETTSPGIFANINFTAPNEGKGWIRLVNVTLSDPAGNQSVPYVTTNHTVIVVNDTTPPQLSYELTPSVPDGEDGWYVSSVDVSIAAQDDHGVISVGYRVGSEDWDTVSGNSTTFSVSTSGNHTVHLKATDIVGNANTTSFPLKVDTTPPTTEVTLTGTETESGVYKNSVTVNLTADDAASGVDYIEYNLNGAGWKTYGGNFSVTAVGAHTLAYGAVDRAGNTEQDEITSFEVTNNTEPSANFSYTPPNPSTADTVQFTDASSDPDGSITSWEWSFGDGGSSAQQNPTHRYSDNGSYPLELTVTDDQGSSDTVTHTITVSNVGPTAGFSYSPSNPSTADTVRFSDGSADPDGSITSWEWSFGDGDTSTQPSPSHSYSADGTYTVTLAVTDDDGKSTSTSQQMIVSNHPPAAGFSYIPHAPTAQDTITFTSQSSDPDGSIESASWDFGDGSTGTGEEVAHSYETPGTYTVALTVTDDTGNTDSVQQVVPVNDLPVAAFDAPLEGVVGTPVNVTDRSSDTVGGIVNWTWQFGDGNQSYGKNASHRYSEAGTYTVTLQVKDSQNATDTVSHTITIKPRYEFSIIGIHHQASLFGADSVTMSIENTGGKAADGVACTLFIDGAAIQTRKTGEVTAGGTATLSFTVDVSPLRDHTIKGVVDPDDEFKEGTDNDNDLSIKVPMSWLLVALMAAAVAAIAGVALFLYRRRQRQPVEASGHRQVQVQDGRQIQRCFVCRGKLKADATAVQCTCGNIFHRSCAKRVGNCPDCGRELDVGPAADT